MAKLLVKKLKTAFYGDVETPQKRYIRAIEHFAQPGSKHLLDLGCGHVFPTLRALSNNTIFKVGIDMGEFSQTPSESMLYLTRGDVSRLPFQDETFHLIISRSVFEHLEKPDNMFREVRRILKPGGRFVFLTPNRWDYVSLVASLFPNKYHGEIVRKTTGRTEEDTFPTFYRANTTRQLRSLAASSHLEIDDLVLLRQHPHYLQFNPLFYMLGLSYEQIFSRLCSQLRPWILGVFRRT